MASPHQLVVAYCHEHGICSSCKRAWAAPDGRTCTGCKDRAEGYRQKRAVKVAKKHAKARAKLTAGWHGWERSA